MESENTSSRSHDMVREIILLFFRVFYFQSVNPVNQKAICFVMSVGWTRGVELQTYGIYAPMYPFSLKFFQSKWNSTFPHILKKPKYSVHQRESSHLNLVFGKQRRYVTFHREINIMSFTFNAKARWKATFIFLHGR